MQMNDQYDYELQIYILAKNRFEYLHLKKYLILR